MLENSGEIRIAVARPAAVISKPSLALLQTAKVAIDGLANGSRPKYRINQNELEKAHGGRKV